MNRIKRFLGFRSTVIEHAWADTQSDLPDTVLLPSQAEADAIMEELRQAAMANDAQREPQPAA